MLTYQYMDGITIDPFLLLGTNLNQDLTNQQYLMEDITRLPDITSLVLDIHPEGHSVGACVFHVLRMCTGVTWLQFTLVSATSQAEVILSILYLYLVKPTLNLLVALL